MNGWLWITPPLTSLTTWLLARLAMWLLLNPVEQIKMAGLPLQGLLIRRQGRIASGIGKLAAKELSTAINLSPETANNENIQKIMPMIEGHIDNFLRNRLGKAMPMIGMFIGDKTIAELKSIFMKELEEIFPLVMKTYLGQMQEDSHAEKLISAKLAAIAPEKFKAMLLPPIQIARKWILPLAATIGLMVGLLQLMITLTVINS